MAKYWAVVPAAGHSRRMNLDIPKQYLPLAGCTVLENTLKTLLAHPKIQTLVVVISPEDKHWHHIAGRFEGRVGSVTGGSERCISVLNGLRALQTRYRSRDRDWVLVHDAARPCVRLADITKLIATIDDDQVGGLLAAPVYDTIKQSRPATGCTALHVETTLDRRRLWQALTPQMFRLDVLIHALEQALCAGAVMTDEAAAIERLGLKPQLIEGHRDNIKITRADDLALAEFFLSRHPGGRHPGIKPL